MPRVAEAEAVVAVHILKAGKECSHNTCSRPRASVNLILVAWENPPHIMTGLSTVATAEPHTLVKEHEKVRKVGEERRDKFQLKNWGYEYHTRTGCVRTITGGGNGGDKGQNSNQNPQISQECSQLGNNRDHGAQNEHTTSLVYLSAFKNISDRPQGLEPSMSAGYNFKHSYLLNEWRSLI